MSKFKVGDKVREELVGYGDGTITEVRFDLVPQIPYLVSFECGAVFWLAESRLKSISREFIVLRREGDEVIASHKRGDEIVKTAKATCNASDAFDFNVGAKLAFDRLMGREEPKEPKAKYVPKLYDRVMTRNGAGAVVKVFNRDWYTVAHDTWRDGHTADDELNIPDNRAWNYSACELTPIKE